MDIVVECKPDEALVRALGFTKKNVTHQPSKARVLSYLDRNSGAIGIVDEDPGTANAGYFSKYTKISEAKFDIEEWSVTKMQIRLIIIKPRLEEWIIRQANSSKIDLRDYSLEPDGYHLHKIINEKLDKFEALLTDLLKEKNQGLVHLKSIISSGNY